MKKKLIYILTSNLAHAGITLKVQSQRALLDETYKTTLLYYRYSKSDTVFKKLWAYVVFHYFFLQASVSRGTFYIRYNAKFPLIYLLLIPVSLYKRIIIEHNSVYTQELPFLGRRSEAVLHKLSATLCRFIRCSHNMMTEDMRVKINQEFHFKHTQVCPNVIPKLPRKVSLAPILHKRLKSIKKTGKKWGIFVGSDAPWHGIQIIIDTFKDRNDCEILIVGNINTEKYTYPKHFHFIAKQSIATVFALYKDCDFGIGSMRWDILGYQDVSALKTQEYLAAGLPILINYNDPYETLPTSTGIIFNIRKNPSAVTEIMTATPTPKAFQNFFSEIKKTYSLVADCKISNNS